MTHKQEVELNEWIQWFEKQAFYDKMKSDAKRFDVSTDMLLVRAFAIGYKSAKGEYKKEEK
jgi:hypothetical protein